MKKGIVYLVGAGPGDPGLITVKAVECLRYADVVVYDYLANKFFLSFSPPKSRKVYVGKKGASHSKDQEDINQLLIHEARRGKVVVRLKGGDPFVFGRGGEEAEALAEAGISFAVVPGVTSAIAAPAYAGIPVTHRNFTSAVAFVTGHEQDEKGLHPPDWNALSKIGTVIFLMSYAHLSKITNNLIDAGRDPNTPAAVIEWGTLPKQKRAIGTLRTIADEVHKMNLRPPTITVVGEVVSLHDKIDWFEKKPLFGKRILVTRSREQARHLSLCLGEEGATVFEIPTIEFKAPSSWTKVDSIIRRISKYQWLVFTSVNGVDFFFRRLRENKRDLRDLKGLKIASVGPVTRKCIEEKGIRVDLEAKEYQTEGLIKAMGRQKIKGKKILLIQARDTRKILPEEMIRWEAKVDVAEVYRSILPNENKAQIRSLIERKEVDLFTFASSTMVENLIQMIGEGSLLEEARKIPAAVIGPITAKTARQHGFRLLIQPKRSTIPSLVDEIKRSMGRV